MVRLCCSQTKCLEIIGGLYTVFPVTHPTVSRHWKEIITPFTPALPTSITSSARRKNPLWGCSIMLHWGVVINFKRTCIAFAVSWQHCCIVTLNRPQLYHISSALSATSTTGLKIWSWRWAGGYAKCRQQQSSSHSHSQHKLHFLCRRILRMAPCPMIVCTLLKPWKQSFCTCYFPSMQISIYPVVHSIL